MQQALDSSEKAIILISGQAGVGKSTLAKQARKFARQTASIFMAGKFKPEYYQPFAAFVEACNDLSDLLMHPPAKYGFTPSQVIRELHSKLDPETKDLLTIFPKLKQQYLTVLTSTNLLKISQGTMKWNWDLDVIKRQTLATTNVVDMIVGRLQSLPLKLYELLPRNACLGPVFTQTALYKVAYHYCQESRVLIHEYCDSVRQKERVDEDSFDDDLSDILCREALLSREDGGIYRWQHDKILEALMRLVDKETMEQIKFEIGRLLLRELSQ